MTFPRILLFLCLPIFVQAQQTITSTITHDGKQREYTLYIPAIYDDAKATPLVFNFHGFGSNAFEQMFYGDFRVIADTANFLIVHPKGTLFNNTTHFNVGGFTNGSTTDDVGFTAALIDSLSATYTIDANRIYSTGMSNGGFMSFLLSCQLSDRFAAIASVTGSMTPETFTPCNPQHPTPIMQIHGTTDPVVPYNGAAWTKSIQAVLNYWIDFNNCDPVPTTTLLPNISTIDGSTVEHIIYSGGDKETTVEHFKVTGGGHTWPGTAFGSAGTNQDFKASVEIWRFFSRYSKSELSSPTRLQPGPDQSGLITISPNPAVDQVRITRLLDEPLDYQLLTLTGLALQSGTLKAGENVLDLHSMNNGYYLLRIGNQAYPLLISR